MKKFLKWVGLVVAGIVLIASVYVYFASQSEFERRFPVATLTVPLLTENAIDLREGERLAQMRGCHSCHGLQLTGAVAVDIPNVARFTAPNISPGGRELSDSEWVTVLRTGVKPDGTSTWLMPSVMYAHMNDEELGLVMSYVRSMSKRPGLDGSVEMRPIGRAIVAKGDFLSSAREVEALEEKIITFDRNDPVSFGRYLVMNVCSECHAQDLNGRPVANAPSLAVAKGYSAEAFASFMKDGKALGGRELELMSPTARERFSVMTPHEISAMYTFLQSRPDPG